MHIPAGDDVDVLCVGPGWCTRQQHFFGKEQYCLEDMLSSKECSWVSNVHAVPDAFVPILKLKSKKHGIDVDISYAQLPVDELPDKLDPTDDRLLAGMDRTSVASITGWRNMNKLVELNTVNGHYTQEFRDAVRFLKVCLPHICQRSLHWVFHVFSTILTRT